MRDPALIGVKVMRVLAKPFNLLFGSDERGFITLLLSSLALYAVGFPDAATITSVYSAMFGFKGIGEMQGSTQQAQGKDEGLEDIENMMDDALSMAEDFKDEKEAKQ
jgi:hypothetical protein